ncbi:hypothetical protein KCU76_g115, partial [Aureobasidium melanogenum]
LCSYSRERFLDLVVAILMYQCMVTSETACYNSYHTARTLNEFSSLEAFARALTRSMSSAKTQASLCSSKRNLRSASSAVTSPGSISPISSSITSKIASKTVGNIASAVGEQVLVTASARLRGKAIVVFVVVFLFFFSRVVTTSVDDRRNSGLEGQVFCPESIVHSVGVGVHQVAIAAFEQLDLIYSVRFAAMNVLTEYIRSVAAEVAAGLGAGKGSQVVSRRSGKEMPWLAVLVVVVVVVEEEKEEVSDEILGAMLRERTDRRRGRTLRPTTTICGTCFSLHIPPEQQSL